MYTGKAGEAVVDTEWAPEHHMPRAAFERVNSLTRQFAHLRIIGAKRVAENARLRRASHRISALTDAQLPMYSNAFFLVNLTGSWPHYGPTIP